MVMGFLWYDYSHACGCIRFWWVKMYLAREREEGWSS